MVTEIKITNKTTGDEAIIGGDSLSFILDSIDFDEPSVSLESYELPYQIGKSITGVTVGTRKPSISGYVVADMTDVNTSGMSWSDYFDKSREIIEEKKKELNKLISIYNDLCITAAGYMLDARPTSPVKYSKTEKQNNEVLCYFTINLECFNPLFRKLTYNLHMESPNTSYIINNDGESEIGLTFSCEFTGTVVNPKFTNVTTDKYIEVQKTFSAGDKIYIYTDIGDENVMLVGTPWESLVGYVSISSDYIKLQIGENSLQYTAKSGASNMNVYASHTPRYFNIKEM